jgi:hypothetical protein
MNSTRLDEIVSLMDNRYRASDSQLGIFLQRDPLFLNGPSLISVIADIQGLIGDVVAAPEQTHSLATALYSYEVENPVVVVDPFGLSARQPGECWQYWITNGLTAALKTSLRKAAFECVAKNPKFNQREIYKCIAAKLKGTIADNLEKVACCEMLGTNTAIDIDTRTKATKCLGECQKKCDWDQCLAAVDIATNSLDPKALSSFEKTYDACNTACCGLPTC